MSGWTTKKLGEVCEGSIRRLKDIDDERFLYIDISSIDRERKAIVGATEYERIKAPGRAQQVVDVGDVLVSTVRPNLNAVAIVEGKSNIRRIASTGFCVLRASECILPRYIYYFTQVGEFIAPLVAVSEKAAYPSVTDKVVRGVSIPIPPLAEQKRIVAKIDAAFEKIDRLKANAEKNLANAKELFQSALDEAMRPKKGWGEKRLGEIGTTLTGMTPSTKDKSNFGNYMPFVKPADIASFTPVNYREDGLSERGVAASRLVKRDSVLMVCIGASIGKTGYADRDCTCNQQINVLMHKTGFDGRYLYYILSSEKFKKRLISESGQTTLPIIAKSKWENLSVCITLSLDEQKQIAKQLDSLSQKTKALQQNYERQIADCAEMRQAILREAFEGRL